MLEPLSWSEVDAPLNLAQSNEVLVQDRLGFPRARKRSGVGSTRFPCANWSPTARSRRPSRGERDCPHRRREPVLNAVVVRCPTSGVPSPPIPRCRADLPRRAVFAQGRRRLPGRPTAVHRQRAAAIAGLAGTRRHHPRRPLPRRRRRHRRQDGAARVRLPADHPADHLRRVPQPVGHHALHAGSSGSAAAAVAAGLVPVAHASDIGGSIRLPAAWCGVVASSRPAGGHRACRSPTPTSSSMITRSVRDTAAFLDAVGGADPNGIYHLPPPAVPYATATSDAPDGLRIGYVESVEAIDVTVDADCVAAVREAAGLLEALGHHVEPGRPARLLDEDSRRATCAPPARSPAHAGRARGRDRTAPDSGRCRAVLVGARQRRREPHRRDLLGQPDLAARLHR